jgi:hypothetical protein
MGSDGKSPHVPFPHPIGLTLPRPPSLKNTGSWLEPAVELGLLPLLEEPGGFSKVDKLEPFAQLAATTATAITVAPKPVGTIGRLKRAGSMVAS